MKRAAMWGLYRWSAKQERQECSTGRILALRAEGMPVQTASTSAESGSRRAGGAVHVIALLLHTVPRLAGVAGAAVSSSIRGFQSQVRTFRS